MNIGCFIKKQWQSKLRWLSVSGIIVLVLGILIMALCIHSCEREGTPESPSPTVTQNGTDEQPTETEPQSTETEPQPTETEPQPTETEPQPTETEPVTTQPTTEPATGVQSPEEQLTWVQYASYDGVFVEDGSDEPVEDVASILVTNGSEQYLDMAKMTFLLDGQEATFMVTGLPAGASVWVMESDRKTIRTESVLEHADSLTSFRKDAVDTLEGLNIQYAGNILKVTNNRDKTLKNLTLYYKVLHSDGNYLGGITYMVSFGDLEPGQSAEKLAGHYQEGCTDIVRIGFLEQ